MKGKYKEKKQPTEVELVFPIHIANLIKFHAHLVGISVAAYIRIAVWERISRDVQPMSAMNQFTDAVMEASDTGGRERNEHTRPNR